MTDGGTAAERPPATRDAQAQGARRRAGAPPSASRGAPPAAPPDRPHLCHRRRRRRRRPGHEIARRRAPERPADPPGRPVLPGALVQHGRRLLHRLRPHAADHPHRRRHRRARSSGCRRGSISHLAAVAVGLILGGAVGNLADRLFRGHHGAVVDFLYSGFWPTFNVADTCIVVGSFLLALRLWRSERRLDGRADRRCRRPWPASGSTGPSPCSQDGRGRRRPSRRQWGRQARRGPVDRRSRRLRAGEWLAIDSSATPAATRAPAGGRSPGDRPSSRWSTRRPTSSSWTSRPVSSPIPAPATATAPSPEACSPATPSWPAAGGGIRRAGPSRHRPPPGQGDLRAARRRPEPGGLLLPHRPARRPHAKRSYVALVSGGVSSQRGRHRRPDRALEAGPDGDGRRRHRPRCPDLVPGAPALHRTRRRDRARAPARDGPDPSDTGSTWRPSGIPSSATPLRRQPALVRGVATDAPCREAGLPRAGDR